jgi:hypothetical protein
MSITTRINQRKNALASNVVSMIILLHNVPIMKMTRDKKKMEEGEEELPEGKGRGTHRQGV